MRRFVLACAAVVSFAATAHAQPSLAAGSNSVNPGQAVNLTITGTAGQAFALIGSVTWSGFSYAGVSLAVGPDVQILTIGTLDGAGQAVVPFTPPFPARDRYFVQAVTSPSAAFATIVASNRVMLLNNQESRIYMPIGGLVQANGTPLFITPGVTVTKAGSVYTIAHSGFFEFNNPVPSITPSGGATITSISTNFTQTVVTLSADAGFSFTIQSVRR